MSNIVKHYGKNKCFRGKVYLYLSPARCGVLLIGSAPGVSL